RVHVDEEAQDAIAVRRAVGTGVDVHQLVARMRGQVAPLLLEWTKAGGARLPATREPRHGALEEPANALRVLPQDRLRPSPHLRRSAQPGQPIGLRVVADVLALEKRPEAVA